MIIEEPMATSTQLPSALLYVLLRQAVAGIVLVVMGRGPLRR